MSDQTENPKQPRRPYEPPRLFDLGAAEAQAQTVDGTVCTPGGSPATAQCKSGSSAFGAACTQGAFAGGQCKNGSAAAGGACRDGSTAGYQCKGGSAPNTH